MRQRFIVPSLAIALLATLPPSVGTADPASVGSWSEPFELGVVGINATLLRSGEVLLFEIPHRRGSHARVWDPVTGHVRSVNVPFRHDLFCGANSVLPDGRVLVTGGTRYGARALDGTNRTATFSPLHRVWKSGPRMRFRRWYPSNIALPSGDVLVLSGWERQDDPTVAAIERYDASTREIRRLPHRFDRRLELYPRLFLLPDGRIFHAGPERRSAILDPKLGWTASDAMTFGGRYDGSAVLLDGLERVLAFGGGDGPRPTATAEIIDLGTSDPSWRPTGSLTHRRKHANGVLLPDGSVLAVGGGERGLYRDPQLVPELFDPVTETWTEMAIQTAPRMYHSTALLLPDGRVLSAGMDHGDLQTTGEIFSPPYLFRGPRPTITDSPRSVGLDQTFIVQTPEAADIGRVVMMRPGSATHGVNFDQRGVVLDFTSGTGGLTIAAPKNPRVAPPGWYMLFVLSSAGVPSIAEWVQVAGSG